MNRVSTLQTSLVLSTPLMIPIAQAATMNKADYRSTKACISADYKTDKAACAPLKANAKDVCVKEAKAVEVKALADVKLGQEVGKAKLDAAQDKRDADYKVAVEKCDALAGDAKTSCVAATKTKFGKN